MFYAASFQFFYRPYRTDQIWEMFLPPQMNLGAILIHPSGMYFYNHSFMEGNEGLRNLTSKPELYHSQSH